MQRVALIDGDILRYRIGFACERTNYYYRYEKDGQRYEWVTTRKKDLTDIAKLNEVTVSLVREEFEVDSVENCLHSVKSTMRSVRDATGATQVVVYLTGKGNFREEIYPEYKKNRPNKKPVHYKAIEEYLLKYYDTWVIDGMEADDALAIYQSSFPNTIICSIDKDLLQVPGEHYNFVKGEHTIIDEQEGLLRFYTQVLTGDPTDNIPGVKGIGKVTAKNMLSNATTEQEMYAVCKEAWKGDTDAMHLTARLLYLLRHENDRWEPPQDEDSNTSVAI